MSKIEIRPIRNEEIAQAVGIIVGGSLTPDIEDLREIDSYGAAVAHTRSQLGDVLVASFDGELIGVCQVLIFRHFQHVGEWCAEVESMHVRADWRSKGVGQQLLAAAEALARQRGCYRIQLTSNNVRSDAHRFYVANGYNQGHLGFKKILVQT